MLLTLWRAAADVGLCREPAARKIVSVRVRDRVTRAWTVDEVRRLLETARGWPGRYNGIPASAYWTSYIMAAWDTGLRGCDLRSLEIEWIPAHRRLTIRQHKTGRPVTVQIRPETLEAIQATFPPERRMIWPLWVKLRQWRNHARAVVRAAGLAESIGRLRHSSGTAVEAEYPNWGHRHLGNTESVFRLHYWDESAYPIERPMPPRLEA